MSVLLDNESVRSFFKNILPRFRFAPHSCTLNPEPKNWAQDVGPGLR